MMKEENIPELLEDLNERNKELNCLYSVEEVLKDVETEKTEVFNKIIEIIPSGWRYSDICKARLIFDDITVDSPNLKITELKQYSDIIIDGKKRGELQVYYIKPVKQEKGIFLAEERKLITSLSEKIGNYLSYKQLKEYVNSLEQQKTGNIQRSGKEEKLKTWLKEQHLTEAEINHFMKVKISFKKGETICKQGSFSTYIMMLAEGLSKASLESAMEKSFTYKINKPYAFIGLSTLYGDSYYNFSATALVPSTVYLIDRTIFDQIVKTNTKFGHTLMMWYCRNFKLVYSRLGCIANKQAIGRIAETLIYLSEEVFENKIIDNVISRKDIAELAGMSTEGAVRVLSELKKDGTIKTGPRGIEIIDRKLLKTLSLAG
ncbi:MAG: Crp/Fnr family transcriptional regulator [Bacteroidales bacterium]|nr:Crp/Fnr family transcriptional regulator [Bacteroidales bacterium]